MSNTYGAALEIANKASTTLRQVEDRLGKVMAAKEAARPGLFNHPVNNSQAIDDAGSTSGPRMPGTSAVG